eukprot:2009817-Amphidinium_carterae.1
MPHVPLLEAREPLAQHHAPPYTVLTRILHARYKSHWQHGHVKQGIPHELTLKPWPDQQHSSRSN